MNQKATNSKIPDLMKQVSDELNKEFSKVLEAVNNLTDDEKKRFVDVNEQMEAKLKDLNSVIDGLPEKIKRFNGNNYR